LISQQKTPHPSHREKGCGAFLSAPGWNEEGDVGKEENDGEVIRQARIYPVKDTAVKQ